MLCAKQVEPKKPTGYRERLGWEELVVQPATRKQSGRFCRAWSDPADVPDCVTGMALVEANERGPRDTVRANPG